MTISIIYGIMIKNDVGGNVMKFYGVGLKFGGTDDKWELYQSNDCWFMGYCPGEKLRLDKIVEGVQVGDILFAKAYGNTSQRYYYIRAIGLVIEKGLSDDVLTDYKDRKRFKVIWLKYFEKPIPLLASDYNRGGVHTYTIFKEKNEKMIKTITEMMKCKYSPKYYDNSENVENICDSNDENDYEEETNNVL